MSCHDRLEVPAAKPVDAAVACAEYPWTTGTLCGGSFFWSQHYGTAINYIGHAERWDRLGIDGDPAAHDCAVTYWRNGKRLAFATVGRDLDSLRMELAFEQETSA